MLVVEILECKRVCIVFLQQTKQLLNDSLTHWHYPHVMSNCQTSWWAFSCISNGLLFSLSIATNRWWHFRNSINLIASRTPVLLKKSRGAIKPFDSLMHNCIFALKIDLFACSYQFIGTKCYEITTFCLPIFILSVCI